MVSTEQLSFLCSFVGCFSCRFMRNEWTVGVGVGWAQLGRAGGSCEVGILGAGASRSMVRERMKPQFRPVHQLLSIDEPNVPTPLPPLPSLPWLAAGPPAGPQLAVQSDVTFRFSSSGWLCSLCLGNQQRWLNRTGPPTTASSGEDRRVRFHG